MAKICKIVSGGQTGVDRAAFDFALENRIEIGGFVPKNRRAEDGRIADKYPNLIETETENPAERTELNVVNSDATLIVSRGEMKGGSLLTKEFAAKHGKPFLHVELSENAGEQVVEKTREWLDSIDCSVLNIAGPRASEDAEIHEKVKIFLEELLHAKGAKNAKNF